MRRFWVGVVAGVIGVWPVAAQQQPGGPVPPLPPQVPPAPVPSPMAGLVDEAPFFPGASYDPAVPNPSSVLGFMLGSRPATHAQIEAVIHAIAEKSPRVRLFEYGKTYEGRTLYYLAVSSEANIRRLEEIKAENAKLADPRRLAPGEGEHIVETAPAVAWMAYVIHGDEPSGSDAALALAYHLAACTDAPVREMLDSVVVLIDPLMNPDGRDRFLKEIAENRTAQPSVDDQSLLHTGFWPWGRTNHYLFDMNRDWIFCVAPETRGRVVAIGAWHPQYLLESHEMEPQDTFLFDPPREPVNPNVPGNVRKWWEVFARDQAAAFDAHGWRYYTGEWNEEQYPGYTGSWGTYHGAIDNLYEQAGVHTDAVKHANGLLESYRDAVRHQLVSSWANLNTLAAHRKEILADYFEQRKSNLAGDSRWAGRTFAVAPSANQSRIEDFVGLMRLEGIEVFQAPGPFKAMGRDTLGRVGERELPAGTILIPNRQPEAPLVAAMLEFDTRLSDQFLKDERTELLRFHRSKLYDITAWCVPMLYDLDAYELSEPMRPGAVVYRAPEAAAPAEGAAPHPPTAFIFDGADDRSVAAAGRLMERGVQVRCADKAFEFGGRKFARNSILVTRSDNRGTPEELAAAVDQAGAELGVRAERVWTGLGPGDLPDIGGEHFVLLERPRVAVLGRSPVAEYAFGETWHLLDRTLGVRASFLSTPDWGGMDLRRYNVLVVPSGGGDALKEKMDDVRDWVKAGGTLIATGSAAGAVAQEKGVGGARLLPDVLTKLDEYTVAVAREWEGRHPSVDPAAVWSATPPAEVKYPWDTGEKPEKVDEDEAKRRDKWRAIFMPQGAIVAGRVDDRAWLTGGCGDVVPIVEDSGTVLMAAGDVQAPVRMGAYVEAGDAKKEEGSRGGAEHAEKKEVGVGEGEMSAKKTEERAQGGKKSGEENGREKAPDEKKLDEKKPEEGMARETKPDGGKPDEKKPDDKKSDDKKSGDKKDEEKKPPAPWAPTPAGYELRLRMAGLLWPEAADRIASTAYVTRESVGAGQVILFASVPTFRGSARGTMRMYENALILGPGMGASAPIKP